MALWVGFKNEREIMETIFFFVLFLWKVIIFTHFYFGSGALGVHDAFCICICDRFLEDRLLPFSITLTNMEIVLKIKVVFGVF